MFVRRDTPEERKTTQEDRTLNETDRLFALLILIQSRHVTTRQLAEHFGVSRRTIFRDLQSLERIGRTTYLCRRIGRVRDFGGLSTPTLDAYGT